MKDGRLTREQVAPLLDTDDADLQQAAVAVMSRRPDWSRDSLTLLRKWLASPELSAAQASSLSGALLAFGSDAKVQQLVVDGLADRKASRGAPAAAAAGRGALPVFDRCRSPGPRPWAVPWRTATRPSAAKPSPPSRRATWASSTGSSPP